MGLFTPSSESRRESIRTGAAIPTRSERTLCWTARDAYFACLDANGIINAHADATLVAARCPEQSKLFERDCARQWVKYFKDWRVADDAKRRRIEKLEREGAVPIDIGVKPVN